MSDASGRDNGEQTEITYTDRKIRPSRWSAFGCFVITRRYFRTLPYSLFLCPFETGPITRKALSPNQAVKPLGSRNTESVALISPQPNSEKPFTTKEPHHKGHKIHESFFFFFGLFFVPCVPCVV